jgi:hypothetical protein
MFVAKHNRRGIRPRLNAAGVALECQSSLGILLDVRSRASWSLGLRKPTPVYTKLYTGGSVDREHFTRNILFYPKLISTTKMEYETMPRH